MLRTNRLKQQIATGEPVYGLFCSIPSPAMIELIAEAGYDFVIIDTEHVLINPETIENMIRTAESYQLTPLVRVGDTDPKTLLRLLDGGAQGIVLPMVESADQVRQAVQSCKYFPEGNRSLNAGRPGSFGKSPLKDYVTKANAEIIVVAMIESQRGVENLEDIVTVPHVDMILEGAADLSQSLGIPWQTSHDDVQNALHYCHQIACNTGIPYCAIPRTPEDHDLWLNKGVTRFVLGDERGTAFRALQDKINTVKPKRNDP